MRLYIFSQGVPGSGAGAARPLLQDGRRRYAAAADVRAEQLEPPDVPESGRGRRAPRVHRPHLLPGAPHRHVDGGTPDEEVHQL